MKIDIPIQADCSPGCEVRITSSAGNDITIIQKQCQAFLEQGGCDRRHVMAVVQPGGAFKPVKGGKLALFLGADLALCHLDDPKLIGS